MNYPFGEFSIYTDNHPILAETLAFVHRHIYDLTGKPVAILNVLCLLAYLFTIIVFLLIFREYKIVGIWAIVGSLLITFLTPQTNRLMAHYSLSYSFMFPIVWLLVLKILNSDRKWIFALLLCATMLVESLIHTYHLFIALVFLGGFTMLHAISYKFRSKSIPYLLAVLVVSAISFLVFTKVYDNIPDRPQFPFGISTYTTSIAGTFLPYKTVLADYIKEHTSQYNSKAESHGYLGLATILILIFSLCYQLRNRIRKKEIIGIPKSLQIAVIAAMLAWLFGTNWINEYSDDFLYKILPPLRQFRGLGRLGWIFYYVITFYCVYFLHQYYQASKNKSILKVCFLALALVWSVDVYFSMNGVAKRMDHRNKQLGSARNKVYNAYLKNGLDKIDFQAMLSLPFCHIGNEKIAIERGAFTMSYGMGLSYCSGLPMINSMMSRTSISQGLNQIQLLNSKELLKPLINEFDERDILILLGPEKPSNDEKRLIEKAQLLGQGNDFSFYRIRKEDFITAPVLDTLEYTKMFKNGKELLVTQKNDPFLMYEHFDENVNEVSFIGAGSGNVLSVENNLIFNYELQPNTSRTNIHLSFWMYVDPNTMGLPVLQYSVIEKEKTIFETELKYLKRPTSYNSWLYFEFLLEVGKNTRNFQLSSNRLDLQIDEMLIRSETNHVKYYDKESNLLLYDNVPIKSMK